MPDLSLNEALSLVGSELPHERSEGLAALTTKEITEPDMPRFVTALAPLLGPHYWEYGDAALELLARQMPRSLPVLMQLVALGSENLKQRIVEAVHRWERTSPNSDAPAACVATAEGWLSANDASLRAAGGDLLGMPSFGRQLKDYTATPLNLWLDNAEGPEGWKWAERSSRIHLIGGLRALPALCTYLPSHRGTIRRKSIEIIGRIVQTNRDEIIELSAQTDLDPKLEGVIRALNALLALTRGSPGQVMMFTLCQTIRSFPGTKPILLAATTLPERVGTGTWTWVTEGLIELGSSVIPSLVELIAFEPSDVGRLRLIAVCEVLTGLALQKPEWRGFFVEKLVKLLDAEPGDVQEYVALSLGACGAAAKERAEPVLSAKLKGAPKNSREQAVLAAALTAVRDDVPHLVELVSERLPKN